MRLEQVVGKLLSVASPGDADGNPALRPLWAEEAMHRAYNMIQLCSSLYREQSHPAYFSAGAELFLAQSIADNIDALKIDCSLRPVACSRIVRDIAGDLVELFGPAVGNVEMTSAIETLYLPCLERRALALLVSELVVNSLIHAFTRSRCNRIQVTLRPSQAGRARLRVEDSGIGFAQAELNETGVGASLAAVLGGRLLVSRTSARATRVELDFPCLDG